MSFSFWLNVNSFTNTWTPLITKSNGSEATRTYSLWLRNDGMLRLDSADGTREYLESSGGVIGLNSWKHVAGIVDRNAGEYERLRRWQAGHWGQCARRMRRQRAVR